MQVRGLGLWLCQQGAVAVIASGLLQLNVQQMYGQCRNGEGSKWIFMSHYFCRLAFLFSSKDGATGELVSQTARSSFGTSCRGSQAARRGCCGFQIRSGRVCSQLLVWLVGGWSWLGRPDNSDIRVQWPVVVNCNLGNTGARPFFPSAWTIGAGALLMVHNWSHK